jgi:2'-5' RNA ligase
MPDPEERPLRLFLALRPAPAVREALAARADAWTWTPAARRTPADKLHITLHFLGDVAPARLPALRAALAVDWSGCELVLDREAVWPGGIAVLEASVVPPALAALHAQLGERLRALDLPVETRRWRPHVTFARKAAGAHPPVGTQPLRWRAGPGYVLVRSMPGNGGYAPLQAFG